MMKKMGLWNPTTVVRSVIGELYDLLEPSDSQSGKCRHGGQGDASSSIPVRGGINKERYNVTSSSHFYLHPQASEAEVKATDFFISVNKTGKIVIS